MRLRKRPKETSNKAKTARKPFGDEPRRALPIQAFNDEYNHHMNHVDQADQLRCYNMNLRHTYKGWKALFQFIFNVVLVNCYLLSFHSNVPCRFKDQIKFRTTFIDSLINTSKASLFSSPPRPPPPSAPPAPLILPQKRKRPAFPIPTPGDHVRIWRPRQRECVECRREAKEKNEQMGVKRRPLVQLDQNQRRSIYIKRSNYGCKACDIPLCKEGPCFINYYSVLEVEY